MKTIYIIYCALIALAAFSAPVLAETVGDANNDNRITTADAAVALQMSVGSISPDIERVDVSGDGRVSSLDALMLLSMARKTQVGVTASEVGSGTVDATIDIYNAACLDSGQFDLWFDSSIVNVTGVSSGSIDGTEVPVEDWTVLHGTDSWDCDKLVRVVFDVPGVTGVSGSGTLATIHFELLGMPEDASILGISDGLLVNAGSDEISALWFDDLITVKPSVTVNAPKSVSGTFDATIEICNVADLDSGQFDISFDASVVNVIGVDSGSIGATTVPLEDWEFRDSDTVRVLFNLPGVTGVSGSGTLATIHFEVRGMTRDASILDISNGLLINTGSDEISALWFDDPITVKPSVTINAPEAVSDTFDATIEICNVADLDSGQFDLWFDSSVVNVTGVSSGSIDGTAVPVSSNWTVMHGTDNWDCDKLVRVVFDVPGVTGVSGSGTLATIHFEVLGVPEDISILDLSDGLLANTGSGEISALWFDDLVTVGVPVTVNAPESVPGTFDATIDIADVTDLDSGQFDLSFDSSVVNVIGVSAGSIDATEVGLDGWTFIDSDTIIVIFNLPGADGVSGSGTLATIHFSVTGASGDTSALAISDGLLVDAESGTIPSVWIDDEVSV